MPGDEAQETNEPHPQWKPEYKSDHVYLHVIPRDRAKGALNISPFAIKLEFWLRINNIPFEVLIHFHHVGSGQSAVLCIPFI